MVAFQEFSNAEMRHGEKVLAFRARLETLVKNMKAVGFSPDDVVIAEKVRQGLSKRLGESFDAACLGVEIGGKGSQMETDVQHWVQCRSEARCKRAISDVVA
jgi:hypothetical protein